MGRVENWCRPPGGLLLEDPIPDINLNFLTVSQNSLTANKYAPQVGNIEYIFGSPVRIPNRIKEVRPLVADEDIAIAKVLCRFK